MSHYSYRNVGSVGVRVGPPHWLPSLIMWALLGLACYSMGFGGGVSYCESSHSARVVSLDTSTTRSTSASDGARAASLPRVRPAAGVPMPWAAAVRIRVMYDDGQGIGSGTVVRGDADKSIVLTCAHLFRDRSGAYSAPAKWTRPVAVDTYGPEPGPDGKLPRKSTHVGKVIDFDPHKDVGLVEIRPGRRLSASPVAPEGWRGEVGDPLVSVGCSGGDDPTAWSHRLRGEIAGGGYHGLVVTPKPVSGRSGGGLHTLKGEIVGVCNAASVVGPEGYYAAPTSIRHVVDRNGLQLVHGVAEADDPGPDLKPAPVVPGQSGHRPSPAKPSPQAEAAPPSPAPASEPGSWAERALGISGMELRLGVVGALVTLWFRRRRSADETPPPRPKDPVPLRIYPEPAPEDPWDRVMSALEAAAAHDSRTKETARKDAERAALKDEILGKVVAMISPTPAPKASAAPSAG